MLDGGRSQAVISGKHGAKCIIWPCLAAADWVCFIQKDANKQQESRYSIFQKTRNNFGCPQFSF